MTDPREFIRNFSFDRCSWGNQGFERLMLQCFGYSGHGTSSFINTCIAVWENAPYMNHTEASSSYGGHTVDRLTYQLTENISLVDNRGCSTMRSHEIAEIYAQMANLLPVDQKVDWGRGFQLADRIVEAESKVKSSDFICPIFVYSVACSLHSTEAIEVEQILKTCKKMTGMDPTIVLTHKSKGIVTQAEDMFKQMGYLNIYSLENCTPHNPFASSEVQEQVISFLNEVVKDALYRVDHPIDRQEENGQRKIFVLNYVHQTDLESHRRSLEKQKTEENAAMEDAIRLLNEEAEIQRQKEYELHMEKMRQLEEEELMGTSLKANVKTKD